MNKCLLLLLLFAGSPENTAQPLSKHLFRFGIKGGLTNSVITGGRVKSSVRITLAGGLWLQLKLSKHWTAQAEAFLTGKGYGDLSENGNTTGQYAVALHYAELPILFQYHLRKFLFEFGPGLGVLVYQHENLVGAPWPNMTGAYPFKTSELSFNAGLAFSINKKWETGLRFTHSLLPVRKQIPDISKQVYNRVLMITCARTLNFKKEKNKAAENQE